jgi:hypothetical protein
MNNKSIPLAEQRERLLHQAAAQCIEPWRIPLARVDRGLAAVQAIRRNPVWLIGSAALIVVLMRGNIMKWLRRGWVAWQMLRGMRTR